jgi:regulator of replication initiation timing
MFQVPEQDFLDMKEELQRLREENAELKLIVSRMFERIAAGVVEEEIERLRCDAPDSYRILADAGFLPKMRQDEANTRTNPT